MWKLKDIIWFYRSGKKKDQFLVFFFFLTKQKFDMKKSVFQFKLQSVSIVWPSKTNNAHQCWGYSGIRGILDTTLPFCRVFLCFQCVFTVLDIATLIDISKACKFNTWRKHARTHAFNFTYVLTVINFIHLLENLDQL